MKISQKYTLTFVCGLFLHSLAGCVGTPKKILTMEDYAIALNLHVSRKFKLPEESRDYFDCKVKIEQSPSGVVSKVKFEECNESKDFKSAVEKAVYNSSPLPLPDNSSLFEPQLRIHFCKACK